jgi:hypothetical protein
MRFGEHLRLVNFCAFAKAITSICSSCLHSPFSAFLPIFYLADNGLSTIQTSQAGSMTTSGAPNDLLENFNPLTVIVMVPILNYGVSLPTLSSCRVSKFYGLGVPISSYGWNQLFANSPWYVHLPKFSFWTRELSLIVSRDRFPFCRCNDGCRCDPAMARLRNLSLWTSFHNM